MRGFWVLFQRQFLLKLKQSEEIGLYLTFTSCSQLYGLCTVSELNPFHSSRPFFSYCFCIKFVPCWLYWINLLGFSSHFDLFDEFIDFIFREVCLKKSLSSYLVLLIYCGLDLSDFYCFVSVTCVSFSMIGNMATARPGNYDCWPTALPDHRSGCMVPLVSHPASATSHKKGSPPSSTIAWPATGVKLSSLERWHSS